MDSGNDHTYVLPPGGDQTKMDHHETERIPVDETYARLRAEDEDSDANSAFSIASTRFNFHWEHGRWYQDYRGTHPFPHDEMSQENERVLHALVLFLLEDKLVAAPASPGTFQSVLDVGCGIGLWAEDVADRYPDCQVFGIDVVIQPSVRPNCHFLCFSFTDEWVFDTPGLEFDFIHIRSLFASLAPDDWPQLYRQCFQHMQSGGWVEQTEVEIKVHCDDNTANPNGEVEKLAKLSYEMGDAYGTDFRIADRMKEEMEAAGFEDVQEVRFRLPLGPWSADPRYKEIGKFYERFYKTGLQGWLMRVLTTRLGWTAERVNEQVLKTFGEIDSRENHYYFYLVIAAGRKP